VTKTSSPVAGMAARPSLDDQDVIALDTESAAAANLRVHETRHHLRRSCPLESPHPAKLASISAPCETPPARTIVTMLPSRSDVMGAPRLFVHRAYFGRNVLHPHCTPRCSDHQDAFHALSSRGRRRTLVPA
jgi:hypothetical protein